MEACIDKAEEGTFISMKPCLELKLVPFLCLLVVIHGVIVILHGIYSVRFVKIQFRIGCSISYDKGRGRFKEFVEREVGGMKVVGRRVDRWEEEGDGFIAGLALLKMVFEKKATVPLKVLKKVGVL